VLYCPVQVGRSSVQGVLPNAWKSSQLQSFFWIRTDQQWL